MEQSETTCLLCCHQYICLIVTVVRLYIRDTVTYSLDILQCSGSCAVGDPIGANIVWKCLSQSFNKNYNIRIIFYGVCEQILELEKKKEIESKSSLNHFFLQSLLTPSYEKMKPLPSLFDLPLHLSYSPYFHLLISFPSIKLHTYQTLQQQHHSQFTYIVSISFSSSSATSFPPPPAAPINSFTTLPKIEKLKKNPDHAAKY